MYASVFSFPNWFYLTICIKLDAKVGQLKVTYKIYHEVIHTRSAKFWGGHFRSAYKFGNSRYHLIFRIYIFPELHSIHVYVCMYL
jgi:hypothetical protein